MKNAEVQRRRNAEINVNQHASGYHAWSTSRSQAQRHRLPRRHLECVSRVTWPNKNSMNVVVSSSIVICQLCLVSSLIASFKVVRRDNCTSTEVNPESTSTTTILWIVALAILLILFGSSFYYKRQVNFIVSLHERVNLVEKKPYPTIQRTCFLSGMSLPKTWNCRCIHGRGRRIITLSLKDLSCRCVCINP
jgi:hypothetical protein